LILDEATSAMDMETEAKIKEIISNLEIATLVIAHRLSTIQNAHQIYVMKDGKIIESGKHEHLLKNDDYYKNLYSFQMGKTYLHI
jgi:ABC-type multidrug transport system fused ATPase/permease subunit